MDKSAIASLPLPTLHSPLPTPLKLALFGVGRWGSHLLRNFLALPEAQVVAIVDPCLERLEQLSNRFDLTPDILLSTDWNIALSLADVEAVVIATPAVTHYGLIRSALERGCHVLAEKPITLDGKEAIELCQLAAQQQRQLIVDHTYLFHPAVQRGREVIQQGQIGSPRYGYAARTHLGPVRQDVDALWDLAIHDIAIFNSWLNQTPIAVQAQGTNWLHNFSANSYSCAGDSRIAPTMPSCADNSRIAPTMPSCAGDSRITPTIPDSRLPTPHSDLVWLTLTYPNGFQAVIHLCWSNPDKQRRLSVVGSQGTLVFDELAAAPLSLIQGRLDRQTHPDSSQPLFVPVDQQTEALLFEPLEPLQQVCSHFLTCIQQNQPSSISSGWLGAELVQILAALTRSLQTGEVVHLRV
ncbi:Gfo/Idh/MocA family protein [Egbenema bharatensis]|uniref:Gfo/Idh/MocA family protein n=1 Tax=Egbenema bharatensis TaxID=3463334 RepID=UPI003A86801E